MGEIRRKVMPMVYLLKHFFFELFYREADLRDSGRVMDLHKVKLEDAEK